uniref:Uncharacterized protein n=1 Tax=Arundo donax TaxID=35708 RepID=A0A0A9A8A4_ARUDO
MEGREKIFMPQGARGGAARAEKLGSSGSTMKLDRAWRWGNIEIRRGPLLIDNKNMSRRCGGG